MVAQSRGRSQKKAYPIAITARGFDGRRAFEIRSRKGFANLGGACKWMQRAGNEKVEASHERMKKRRTTINDYIITLTIHRIIDLCSRKGVMRQCR